jgi:hypothetical protein
MRAVGAVDRATIRCASRSGGRPSRGSRQPSRGHYGSQGGHGHEVWQPGGLFDQKFLKSPFAGKHPKLISKGTKVAAAEAAVTAAEAIAVADSE